jgi:hypothetical protein
MAKKKTHNPEKRSWKGKSHKKWGGKNSNIKKMREKIKKRDKQ